MSWRAKHILLLTQDSQTGQALSEEEAAQKKAKAEELLAQLQADFRTRPSWKKSLTSL